MGQDLIVQKYGGVTLSDPERIKAVAQNIATLVKSKNQVVTVVSAMGKTTNSLMQMAFQVSTNPKQREMDMLLTTGERISMALLGMALNDLGCDAISFTGSQAGILTDDSHVGARIVSITPFRVQDALAQGKTVVLAGFQGVSPSTKEVTTLGRGGSDITAIAMAAHLKASRCEILKENASVFSADPKVIPHAKAIPYLSYSLLCEMSFWGAKMLNYRAAELAARYRVPLFIGSASEPNTGGTWIKGEQMFEQAQVLSVSSFEKVLEVTVLGGVAALEKLLLQKNIGFPQLLQVEQKGKQARMLITGAEENLASIERSFKQAKELNLRDEELASVTLIGHSLNSPELIKTVLAQLDQAKISVEQVLMSPQSVTAILRAKDRITAIKVLHELVKG